MGEAEGEAVKNVGLRARVGRGPAAFSAQIPYSYGRSFMFIYFISWDPVSDATYSRHYMVRFRCV